MVKNTKKKPAVGWIAWAKRLNGFQKLLLGFAVFLVASALIIVIDTTIHGDDVRKISMLGPP